MRIHTFLALVLLVSGCGLTESRPIETANATETNWPETNIRAVLQGRWGWNDEQCEEDPFYITFSSDGANMYFDTKQGLVLGNKDQIKNRLKYQILDETDRVLRTVVEGEDRRTEKGHVVGWDLVLINNNSFCWRRWDWASDGCTQPVVSCN